MGYQEGGSPGVEALPPPPPGLGFDAHSWLDIEPTAAVRGAPSSGAQKLVLGPKKGLARRNIP